MSNKLINARMQQKIDTYENWSKAINFIPLKGELIIYTTDENGNEKIGFKVGTGEQDKNVHQLDFVSLSEAAATVSWNDLTDKPFGEVGTKIEWDGNTEGLSTFNLFGAFDFYKVSSDTVDISGAEIVSHFDGDDIVGNIGVDSSLVLVNTDNGNQCCLYGGQIPIVIVVNNVGADFAMGTEMNFTEEGTWSFRSTGEKEFVQSLQKDYSFKTLDRNYIPSEIGTWEGMPDKPFYETGFEFTYDESQTYESFSVPTMGAVLYKIGEAKTKDELIGATGKYVASGSEGEFVIDESCFQDCTDDRAFVIMGDSMGLFAVSSDAITTEFMGVSFSFPSAGTWNVCVDGAYTPTYLGNLSIKQLDKKFIPDDITAAVNLTFDETPTEGSQNPVKSMGIHSAISALEGKITSTFCYKGTVDNYSDLPTDGNTIGDVWNIANADEANGVNAGDNAAWNGTGWDILAGVIDLSDYYTKTEIDSIALNGTVNLANYYTKAEIDNMIGDCDTIIGYINTLIGGVSV